MTIQTRKAAIRTLLAEQESCAELYDELRFDCLAASMW